MVKVKICGIRSERDIEAAYGADALGFIVETPQSRRNLELGVARRLMKRVPLFVARVAVTVLTEPERLAEIAQLLEPDALQVHAELTLSQACRLRELLPLHLYALLGAGAAPERVIARGRALEEAGLDGVILDTQTKGQVGGTGQTHDWSFSRQVRDGVHPFPVVLAGGLTPENVQSAIAQVQPYAVDVASGVEGPDGAKSREKIQKFLQRVKSYDDEGQRSRDEHHGQTERAT